MMNLTMKTVEFGTIIMDTRDEKIWKILAKDSKAKTIMMETVKEDGTTFTRPFCLSTINKNFEDMHLRECGKPETVQEPETEQTVPAEVAPVAEPVKEQEKKEKKEKKERKPRQKKENPDRDKFIAALDELIAKHGYIKITYEKVGPNFIVLRTEEKGRIKYEFYLGVNEVKINMKPAVAEALELDYNTAKKYFLPANVRLAYDDENITKTVDAILEIK